MKKLGLSGYAAAAPVPMLPNRRISVRRTSKPIARRGSEAAPPKKILFLHGYGARAGFGGGTFQLGGLAKAFPRCTVNVQAGTYKLGKKDFDSMPKGELRDMAEAGDIDVFGHAPTGTEASKNAMKEHTHDHELKPAIDALENRIVKDGGYDILAGFSQGGRVIYGLLDRLPALTRGRQSAARVKLVAMWGSGLYETPPPARSLEGKVKAFICQGEATRATSAAACRNQIDGDMWQCDVCNDFDLCVKCFEDHANACKKLPRRAQGGQHDLHAV